MRNVPLAVIIMVLEAICLIIVSVRITHPSLIWSLWLGVIDRIRTSLEVVRSSELVHINTDVVFSHILVRVHGREEASLPTTHHAHRLLLLTANCTIT